MAPISRPTLIRRSSSWLGRIPVEWPWPDSPWLAGSPSRSPATFATFRFVVSRMTDSFNDAHARGSPARASRVLHDDARELRREILRLARHRNRHLACDRLVRLRDRAIGIGDHRGPARIGL